MEAVVDPEEDFFSVFGDKKSLGLGGGAAVVFGRIETDRTDPEVGAFVTAVETLFPTTLDVRAEAVFADCGEGTAVVVGPAGAAPLPEETVITRKSAIRDRVRAFACEKRSSGGENDDICGRNSERGRGSSVVSSRLGARIPTKSPKCFILSVIIN
jgi:hypothetical protein